MKELFTNYAELLAKNIGEEMSFKDASLEACKKSMSIYIEENITEMNSYTMDLLSTFTHTCSKITECAEKSYGNGPKNGFGIDIVIPEVKDVL